jgi:hypothetical protein
MFGSRSRNYGYDRTTATEPFGTEPTTARTTRRRRGLFGDRHADTTTTGTRRGFFTRKIAPERRAAGLRGSLANPNTTHAGRQEAKAELREMGQSAHVPLSVKVSRARSYGELILTSPPIRSGAHWASDPRLVANVSPVVTFSKLMRIPGVCIPQLYNLAHGL